MSIFHFFRNPLLLCRQFNQPGDSLSTKKMPPIRRYLRITKYTVLEVRIHLDSPSQTSWLLNGANPALPRIISAIRPMLLPKLREEYERSRAKGAAKKKTIKDVVTEDDFEVSIFLTETSTRHSLLAKSKSFAGMSKRKKSLKGWLKSADGQRPGEPIHVPEEDAEEDDQEDDGDGSDEDIILIRNESDSEDAIQLATVPTRPPIPDLSDDAQGKDPEDPTSNLESGDGKKLAPKTFYDGFSIYGRILCLVVKRRGTTSMVNKAHSSQHMMENWVSTQAAQVGIEMDEDG